MIAFAVSASLGVLFGVATRFARKVLTPAETPDNRLEVVATNSSNTSPIGISIVLCGPEADLEGELSYIFDAGSRHTQSQAGHARIGPPKDQQLVEGKLHVSRDVLQLDRGELRVGARGRITGWWFAAPEQLGYQVEHVRLSLPLGPAPAWLIRPNERDVNHWAIHVHGRGALPHETLRGVIPFATEGFTNLVISYRNDPGAPSGIRGRYGLGLAESADVEAAMRWAISQGATHLTLVGWSMGATACVCAARGPLANYVVGMVLESPALDWCEILLQQAKLARVPKFLSTVGMWLLRSGIVPGAMYGQRGTPLSQLCGDQLASLISVPTLIHASPDDTFVPWNAAVRAATKRPMLITLAVSQGEHVKLWNVNPTRWHTLTQQFIRDRLR